MNREEYQELIDRELDGGLDGAVAGCLLLLELLMRERRAKHAVGLAVFVVLQFILGCFINHCSS